ncbi:L* protein [Saffold virus 6]|uniref:L* protein n=1 Tax=Saffold virus 6 TaxID=2779854 RepID=C3U5A8_9PICO|nr:L* protein [Saffold virus 6]
MAIWRANTDIRFCALFALLLTFLQMELLLSSLIMSGTRLTF